MRVQETTLMLCQSIPRLLEGISGLKSVSKNVHLNMTEYIRRFCRPAMLLVGLRQNPQQSLLLHARFESISSTSDSSGCSPMVDGQLPFGVRDENLTYAMLGGALGFETAIPQILRT
jgi:hypothetical protein